jgi:flavin reductase (DIM6/NTAB) family NADH-FMN oxidoreductase RutF
MFYRPEDGHGLPRNPFTAIISPRPIGWISTRGSMGDNLAPYSFFNAVAYEPPQVAFASTGAKPDRDGAKDSLANIRETGVFSASLASWGQREAMNLSSGPWPRETDEFALAGLARAACATIACARVADAPATLECRLVEIVRLRGAHNALVIGEVTGVWLRDDCVSGGRFDTLGADLIARLGGRLYTRVTDAFAMDRPTG